MSSVSHRTKAKSVRLENELWDKLEWLAQNEGIRTNDFIKAAVVQRLATYSVPDLTVPEGQRQLFETE